MLIIQIIYNGKLWDRIPSLIFVFNGVKQRVLLFSIFGVQINQQWCWMLFVGLVLNPIPIELKKPRLGTKRYVITPRPFPNHSPTSTRKRVSTQFKLKFLKGLGTHFSCSSTLHFCCGTRACTTEEPPPLHPALQLQRCETTTRGLIRLRTGISTTPVSAQRGQQLVSRRIENEVIQSPFCVTVGTCCFIFLSLNWRR